MSQMSKFSEIHMHTVVASHATSFGQPVIVVTFKYSIGVSRKKLVG